MGKARKHSAEQIVNLLRQIEVSVANGETTSPASREAGITEQTHYRWRKEYRGVQGDRVRRLKELEQKNSRLKRIMSNLRLVLERRRLTLACPVENSYIGGFHGKFRE